MPAFLTCLARRAPGASLGLALLLSPAAASAQELVGSLRLGPDGPPAAGVVLLALDEASGNPVARTLSSEQGGFVLRLPPRPVQLRALRVGFRPTDLGRFALDEGERRRVELVVAEVPVMLATVTARASARCQTADQAGEAVATLWEEARKALLVTRLASPDGPPTARVLLETALLDPDGRPRGSPARQLRDGLSSRPFRAAPAAQLARLGYRLEESDGITFFAPDADVLLSQEFAGDHCLRLLPADPKAPARVGLAFEPVARSREIVRIKGALWFDRASFALERVEYQYVGLPGGVDRSQLGGSLAFVRLPGGLFFEERWEVRMPRMQIERAARFGGAGGVSRSDALRLEAIQRTGGRVLRIAQGERLLFAAADLAEVTATGGDTLALRAACLPGAGQPADSSGAVVGLVTETTGLPVPRATVTAVWQDRFVRSGPTTFSWTERTVTAETAADGGFVLCGVPRGRMVTLRADIDARRSLPLAVRLAPDAAAIRAELKVPPR